MKVLVACEFSGRVRNAFLARGHDAWSCDLLSGREPTHGRHIKGDVLDLLDDEWDLIIAHPPCTYLTKAGAPKGGLAGSPRHALMVEACGFFKRFLDHPCPRVCVENPIMYLEAQKLIGMRWSQKVQPWWFGDPQEKATCLWLKGLPHLVATNPVRAGKGFTLSVPRFSSLPGLRAHLRSTTFKGMAEAMAEQWGALR